MPNPFHFRARIDRLWRRSGDHNPGYIRLRALNAVVRELFAPNDRARRNYRMYLATDPFDVARHLLRNLYDRPGPMILAGDGSLPLPLGEACPALDAGGWGEGPFAHPKEESPDEEDDPL